MRRADTVPGGSLGACIKLPTWTNEVQLRAGHAGRQNYEASVSGQIEQLMGAAGQSHQAKVETGTGLLVPGSCAAMQHQAKVDTGLGVVPGTNSGAAMNHQAKVAGQLDQLRGASRLKHQAKLNGQAEQQAMVQHWLQAEVQGSRATSPAYQGRTGCTSSTCRPIARQ